MHAKEAKHPVHSRLVVHPLVKYRREGFGCIVINKRERQTHYYNSTAAVLVEACRTPRSLDELTALIGWQEAERASLSVFLERLCRDGVLMNAEADAAVQAELYFTDVAAFPEGYFYAPLGVEIESTRRCARNCTYCSYESGPSVDVSGELSSEDWKAVLDDLKRSGVFFVRFTGGDPFIRKDILELLHHADDLDLLLSVGSDLTVLTEAQVCELSRLRNLLMIQTTLDGARPETNDRFRGCGSFQKTVQGIHLLNEFKIPYIVGSVVHKGNCAEVREVARLVGQLGAVGYCIAPLYSAGRGRDMSTDVPSNAELALANRLYREALSSGEVQAADPSWSQVAGALDETSFSDMCNDQPHLTRKPERLLRVDPEGRCYTSVKLKERLQDEAFAGQVPQEQLLDVWHQSATLARLRALSPQPTVFGPMIDVRRFGLPVLSEV